MASTSEILLTFLAFGLIILFGLMFQKNDTQQEPTTPERQRHTSSTDDFIKNEFNRVMNAIDSLHLGSCIKGKHSSHWRTSQLIKIVFTPKYVQELSSFRLGNPHDRTASMSGFFNINYEYTQNAARFTFDYDYSFVRIGRGGKDKFQKNGSDIGAHSLVKELDQLREDIFRALYNGAEQNELYSKTKSIKQIHDLCAVWTSMLDNSFEMEVFDPILEEFVAINASVIELGYVEKNGRKPSFFIAVVNETGVIYKNTVENIRQITDIYTAEVSPTAISIRKTLLSYTKIRIAKPSEDYSFRDTIINN